MSEPMIIIEPCAGLGNRLLGLGSAYAVAEKLNRRLVVMWKREVGCNISFSELFDLMMWNRSKKRKGMKDYST